MNAGTKSTFTDAMAEKINLSFAGSKETRTYKEAAKVVRVPKTTLYRFATKNMDFWSCARTAS